MSLIAHWPLNGTLEDYSGNKIPLINQNSAIIDSSGPLGKCYSLSPTSSYLYTTSQKFKQCTTNITVSCWAYNENWIVTESYKCIICCADVGGFEIALIYSSIKVNFWINGGYKSILFSASSITPGWHHFTASYDGYTIKLYVDGELKGSNAISTSDKLPIYYNSSNYLFLGGEACGQTCSSNFFQGKICDVRIYDDALSLKEIKEIYKTNILHYSFNNPEEEPTENLIQENFKPYGCSLTLQDYKFNGNKVYKLLCTNPNAGNNFGLGNYSANISIDSNNANKKFLFISFYKKVIVSTNIYTMSYIRLKYSDDSIATITSAVNVSNIYRTNINTWEKIILKYQLDNTKTPSTILSYYIYCDNATGGEVDISQVQFEFKNDNSTPYTSVSRNGTVRDSSGYRNDGTVALATSPSYSTDTNLGSGCFNFSSSLIKNLNYNLFNFGTGNFTVAFWINLNSTNSNQKIIYTGPDGIDGAWYIDFWGSATGIRFVGCKGSNSSSCYMNIPNLTSSTWYHIAFTKNGISYKSYLNDVLTSTTEDLANRNYNSNYSNAIYIGQQISGESLNAKISDFRIYSTALTDDDIKELYQSKFLVDKSNNFYCDEIDEVDVNSYTPIEVRGTECAYEHSTVEGTKIVRGVTINNVIYRFYIRGITIYSFNSITYALENYGRFDTYDHVRYVINNNSIVTATTLGEAENQAISFLESIPVGNIVCMHTEDYSAPYTILKDYLKNNYFVECTDKMTGRTPYAYIGIKGYRKLSEAINTADFAIASYNLPNKVDFNKKGKCETLEIIESNPYTPTLVDYSNWNDLGTGSCTNGGSTTYTQSGSTDENSRIIGLNPWNEYDYLWKCTTNSTSSTTDSNPDGGFAFSTSFTIDNTKKYRFSIWCYHTTTDSSTCNGIFYLGFNKGVNSSGSTGTNPYHIYKSCSSFTQNKWYLAIGYVFGSAYTGTTIDSTQGLYNTDGAFLSIGNFWKWPTDLTTSYIRSFIYYCTNVNQIQYLYRPRVELADSAVPISTLLKGEEHLSLYQLRDTSNKFKVSKNGLVYAKSFNEV